ncbi:pentatricopeptide repeat-containing protein At1g62590-like [Papaver somniferum]|uniref:pentatricopeptide repeat-containing protein At1g62590-like n=1 Tax=Papaver somniferum TaxID=3469 RepID=UPI000E70419A|nr:pentatricopeptide repeat-containing protein At1g62590-like [Papaver somniferum]
MAENTAKRIFNEMQRSAEKFLNERAFASHFPDVVTYILILNGIFQNGKMEEAVKLFESMESPVDIDMYNILIHGFCQAGRLENARKLFNHIPRKRLVPNVVTYNTMIRGLFSNKMFLEAAKLIIKTEEEGCLPNSKTYDTIINGFLGGKETGKALQFLRKMYGRHFASSDSTVINGGSGGKRLATHCRIFAIC